VRLYLGGGLQILKYWKRIKRAYYLSTWIIILVYYVKSYSPRIIYLKAFSYFPSDKLSVYKAIVNDLVVCSSWFHSNAFVQLVIVQLSINIVNVSCCI